MKITKRNLFFMGLFVIGTILLIINTVNGSQLPPITKSELICIRDTWNKSNLLNATVECRHLDSEQRQQLLDNLNKILDKHFGKANK